MWYNLIQFLFKTIQDAGQFANWLFTPLPFSVDLGVMGLDGHYLPRIVLSATPIQFISVGMIGFILVVHLIKLFDPFGG